MKILVLSLALALPLAALAHGSEPHAAEPANAPLSTERHPWGMQGDPKRATRTVRVTLLDAMRFEPARFQFRRGETVTFAVHNAGKLMHEFVIGTAGEFLAGCLVAGHWNAGMRAVIRVKE